MREIDDQRARAGSFVLCGDRVPNHCRHDVRLTASPAGKGLVVAIFFPRVKNLGRLCSLTSMLDSRSPPQQQRLRHPPENRRTRRILVFLGLLLLRPNLEPTPNLANPFEPYRDTPICLASQTSI